MTHVCISHDNRALDRDWSDEAASDRPVNNHPNPPTEPYRDDEEE